MSESGPLGKSAGGAAGSPALLASAAARFEGIISSAMDAIISINQEQRIVLFNPAAQKMFGVGAAEAMGQSIDRFIPERFRAAHRHHVEHFGQTGVSNRRMGALGTISGLRANGEEFPLEASISQLEAGGEKLFTVILRDVTERHRAEEARARLAAIVESSEDAVISKTLDGTIRSWNAAAERLFGYSSQEAVGQAITLIIPPDRQAEETSILERVRRGQPIAHYETVRLAKSGRRIDVSLTVSPIRDAGGVIIGASKILHDITALKEVEAELRASERVARRRLSELETIFKRAPVALCFLDTDLRFVKVNALLAEIHGRSVEEHLGRTVREVLPELADHLEPLFRKILETNTPIRNMEIQGLGPKAPALQRHFLASYFPVKDAEVRYLNGIVVEVTERKRAEDAVRQLSGRLLQLQDEERRRIGSELHDATAQELATAAMDLGRVQQRIAGHDATVDALLSDCQALLAECSRKVRTLSYQLHPPLLDEVGLAGAVQDYARGFMQRSGLQVTLDLCPALGRLTPHIERALFRVVQECLGNVHRHSGSPTAQVRIRRAGSGVVLEITDQGRGFAPEVRISDDGAVSKVGVGITGMRERLRQLGGQLEIESSQQGTTVRATVPGGSEPEQDHAVSDRQ